MILAFSPATRAESDGKWTLKLDPLCASADPKTLTVKGKDCRRVEVKDILVGEVWLGPGQSNMAMTVASCYRFEEEKAAAQLPLIRHYRETSGPAEQPQPEGNGVWQECSPRNVGGFSAVLYFFGREIHYAPGVPVGLVKTSVGGTPIESWVPAEVLRARGSGNIFWLRTHWQDGHGPLVRECSPFVPTCGEARNDRYL